MMKRTRRFLSILLAMVMLTVLVPASAHAAQILPATGCRGSESGEHDWHEYDFVKKPTCTENGTYLYICLNCWETAEGPAGEIPALGHNYIPTDTPIEDINGNLYYPKEATCTENGLKVWYCERCRDIRTEVVPGGHIWDEGTVVTPPGCTVDGVATFTCTRCGTKNTVAIPAPGHTWGNEVVTSPDGLLAGQRLRTCLVCGEEESTAIPVDAAELFSNLRNIPVDAKDASPLVITQQPQGGLLPHESGEGHLLTVAAEGGTKPYTYSWRSVSFENEASTGTFAGLSDTSADLNGSWQSKAKDWYEATAVTYEDVYNADWLEQITGGSNGSVLEDIVVGAHNHGDQEEADFTAWEGGREYWCVVTDAAGKRAVSDKVRVYSGLFISVPPRNINRQAEVDEEDRVWLECRAEGGSGEYLYYWYKDGETMPYGIHDRSECMDPGTYVCVVEDMVTGEKVESDPCVVYDTKPLKICTITGTNEKFWPEEEWKISVTVEGGTPPYEGWLEIDGVWPEGMEFVSPQGEPDSEGRSTLTASGVGGTLYTFHVTDSMGEFDFAVTRRWEKHLTITEQPKDGVIKLNRFAEVACTVADGEAPYTYNLYRNGQPHQVKTSDGRFQVWYPGEYYIRIVDSKGHTGETDKVLLENEKFHVTDYSAAAEITQSGKGVRLYVEVSGGRPPYSHEWLVLTDKGWRSYELGPQLAFYAGFPGTYACRITDSDGNTIRSKDMEVTYSGDTPVIVTQPKETRIPEDGSSVRLSCRAVSGRGNDDDLLYVWYKLTDGKPYMKETQYGYGVQSIKVSSPALYYCRVTDRSTGKSVESNYVWIMQELRAEPGHDAYVYDGTKGSLALEIHGGIAPYTVRAYSTVNGSSILCGEEEISGEGRSWFHFDAYFTTTQAQGDSSAKNTLCPLTLRIFDSAGQEIRSFVEIERIFYGHTVRNN